MSKALDVQEGGDHYKKLAIQPVEYIMKNNLNFCQGSIIKYVTRYKDKNGIEDLQKAKHFIDLLIQLEGMEPEEKLDNFRITSFRDPSCP